MSFVWKPGAISLPPAEPLPARRFGPAVKAILLGLALVLLSTFYSLWAGYAMVGKSFSGFSMEFSFITFPVDSQEWTGSKADFQYYEQIRLVDGKRFGNSSEFRRYVRQLPPATPVRYTLIREGKPVEVTVPTMVFSLSDYLKIFGLNILLAWLYGALTLFILLRRERIQQSRLLLFLTSGFTAVYALRPAYDYLDLFLPVALTAFSAIPPALFLLGTHLAKSGRGGRVYRGLERLNLLIAGGLALTLSALSVWIAPAPYAHPRAFEVFVAAYEVLVTYTLVSILAFMGLVLWSTLRRHRDALKKWQARIILIGSLFSFIPYLVLMGAMYVFKMPWTLPGELAVANTYLFILFVFYAILQAESVALEVFLKKTVFYYLMVFAFAMAYTVVYRLATLLIEASFLPADRNLVPFVAGFAAFALVSFYNSRLQNLISAVFYRQHKSLTLMLERFMEDSTSTLEPDKMINLGLCFIEKAFSPQDLALYLSPTPALATSSLSLYHAVGSEHAPQLRLEGPLRTPAELQAFRRRHGLRHQVVLPLHKNEMLMGLFILDKKASGLGYFAEDLELLEKFGFYFVTGFYLACLSQQTLSAYEKSEAAKRMEVLGTLASGVAHDFNNLLSTIVMSVSLMKYTSEDPQVLERLQVIQMSAEKGAEITRALSDYASTLPPDEAVSLHGLLKDFEARMGETLPPEIQVEIDCPANDVMLLADSEQLQRALLELARNAWIAMAGKGVLRVAVERNGHLPSLNPAFEAPEALCIRISDTGEGIPASLGERIFDPFFSAWNEGKGLGLGLSIARQIVKNHNGLLEYSSVEGAGSSFSLTLPLADPQRHRFLPEVEAAPAQDPAREGLVLLIDDEEALRALLREALEREGYAVIEASDGEQGLDQFRRRLEHISLVVCDLEMPRFNGHQFIAAAHTADPDIPILVSSGNLSPADEKTYLQQGIRVLHKPYDVEQLLGVIRQMHSRV